MWKVKYHLYSMGRGRKRHEEDLKQKDNAIRSQNDQPPKHDLLDSRTESGSIKKFSFAIFSTHPYLSSSVPFRLSHRYYSHIKVFQGVEEQSSPHGLLRPHPGLLDFGPARHRPHLRKHLRRQRVKLYFP